MTERVDLLKRNLSRIVRAPPKTLERPSVLVNPEVTDEPLPVRKARALELMLMKVPIHIYPGELVVGLPFREEPLYTEGDEAPLRQLPPEIVSGEGYIRGAEAKVEQGFSDEPYDPVIPTLRQYGVSLTYGLFPHYATEHEKEEAERLGLDENSNPGHLQAGHARVLALGLNGLIEIANDKLAQAKGSSELEHKRSTFLRSVIISLEAAESFAMRYADLAREMASKESDPKRSEELVKISEVCRRAASDAPRTFWEALQLHWFVHLISNTQGARQLARFDQYMYLFLEGDLREGRLTMEGARELLDCLWIKYNTLTDVTMDNLQNMILGGQTREGRDATNPLSFMCMDATERLGLIDPKWSIRIHKGTPDAFLRRACEIIKSGRYEPGIYNDEAIIPALVVAGVPIEDASDYTNDGCSELLIQGRSNPWAFEAMVNLLKCLERAVEHLEDYETFNELMEAVKKEAGIAVEMATANANLLQAAVPRISPNPFVSATVEGCLERMMDLTEGGATYNFAAVCATGLANTADALAALKKHVFEEGSVGKRGLLDALHSNFEGSERLRLMLLKRAPKFGNEDDYVDSLASELVEHLAKEVGRHRNPRGGSYTLGLFSYGDYISHGMVTGATPDGRRAGEGIAPNFSPAPGRDMKGPFSVFKSTAKVKQLLTANGNALDISIHPTALSGPGGVDKLMSLIKAFRELGGMQVQFNIVDAETLKAAQRNPEQYQNLTVRLWGFPAYFVRLPKDFQDHIIARTGHGV